MKQEKVVIKGFAEVIIPLSFKETLTYSIPQDYIGLVREGAIVKIKIGNTPHQAIVKRLLERPDFDISKIKPIEQVLKLPPIPKIHIKFLEQVAQYYMCSIGEAFRFAAFTSVKTTKREDLQFKTELQEKSSKLSDNPTKSEGWQGPNSEFSLPTLSEQQLNALNEIEACFKNERKPVLLNGVTGSGKTEIYIHLAAKSLNEGKSVLFLVPEIALSRQIGKRLKKVFGEYLLTYHSKKSAAYRRDVYKAIAASTQSHIILGARSALFLPFEELGTIIVDEEHDASYKQTDSAPRYNGRDTALMLSNLLQSNIILGSATPSLETLYNVETEKFREVKLNSRFYGGEDCPVTIVDMNKERRKWAVKGSFSKILINAIEERLNKGEQTLIFRSRRAYASAMECATCGYIPRCPRCNIPLHFHKAGNKLSCHICGYSTNGYKLTCPECKGDQMKLYGPGTEKIEEELQQLFPAARIARFDADSTSSKREEERILKQFASRETDILVGTQMISKGFDFEGLTLAAVIKGEAITSIFDFRADEKGLQLLSQIRGRVGRRGNAAEMIIQTSRPEHPIFKMVQQGYSTHNHPLTEERKIFGYPPYVRIVRLTVKSPYREKCAEIAAELGEKIITAGVKEHSGPIPPPIEKIEKNYLLQFILKFGRDKSSIRIKQQLYELLKEVPSQNLIIDVDPINL